MIEITKDYLKDRLLFRENESHKGDYGHLLIVAGCDSMPGAALLVTGSALQSGCGLVTLHSGKVATSACASVYPSAILSIDQMSVVSRVPSDLSRYTCIAVGPGLGRDESTLRALSELLDMASEQGIPMLLDADALNMISEHRTLLGSIPEGSVMTPHDGELRRLVGKWMTPGEKEEKIHALSKESGCVIVSKGYRTGIFCPEGTILQNTTGNPGMAKGGSGDVLAGLVSGLMARGYPAADAASLGVWIHGYSGDILSEQRTPEAFSSKDMMDSIWMGFKELYG